MKKLIYFIILVAVAWLIKLSYDFRIVSGQVSMMQNELHQNDQKNAVLNDQLVSMQRQAPGVTEAAPTQKAPTEAVLAGVSETVLIRQQLELIQFALQQQQYVYAMEKLTQLDQALDDYAVADSLKQSLHQTLTQDKQSIQQFVLSRHQQLDKFEEAVQAIDTQMTHEMANQKLQPPQSASGHFWQKWFSIEPVAQHSPDLVNRRLILKEVQLRLLTAQRAFTDGHLVEFDNAMLQAIQQLNNLPDHASKQLQGQLQQLQHMQMPAVPKLNSTAVLG